MSTNTRDQKSLRPLGNAIALLAVTGLMAYGCQKGEKRNADVEPPKQAAPAPAEPAKAEPPKAEPPKSEPAKVEPPKTEPPAPAPAADADAKPKLPPIPHESLPKDAKPQQTFTMPSGVIVEEHKAGTGFPVLPKALVTIHFELRVKDSWKLIQSTWNDGEPETRRLEVLVLGLGDGLMGMRKGAIRRVIVPPHRGFGPDGVKDEQGNEIIPGNATLVFDVELIDVKQTLVTEPAPGTTTTPPAPTK